MLVNNAANDARHTVEEVTPEYWDQAMAVNLRHQFFVTQAVIPAMKKARPRIHHQSEFDQLDDPVYGTAGLCHGEGCDCWAYANAGA